MQCNYTEGGQRDCSEHAEKIVPCDIYAPTGKWNKVDDGKCVCVFKAAMQKIQLTTFTLLEICTPTIASTLIDRITVNTPFFGIVFYYSQWAFVVIFVLGFIVALFRQPRDNADVDSEDVEQEEQGLLERNARHHYGANTSSSTHNT